MKHLKKFEATLEEREAEEIEKKETQLEILKTSLDENPMSEDNDFYIFLASDKFEEDKDGRYIKTLDIENMVRITADQQSIGAMQGLTRRSRFQQGVKMYSIWLPKDLRDDVEGKGSLSLESYLVDLINKYKQEGSTDEGKQKYQKIAKEVPERRKMMKDFNI